MQQVQAQVAGSKGAGRRRGRMMLAAAGLAIVGVVGVAGLAASGPQPSSSGPAPASPKGGKAAPSRPASGGAGEGTLDRFVAARLAFDILTVASGELEAKNQIEIRNGLETQTTITDIVEEGKWVKKGDVLVRLNAENIQTQLDDEEARVKSAEADVKVAENALEIQKNENESARRQGELKVVLAQLDLNKWIEGDVKSKRQELALALDKAHREQERLGEKYALSVELEGQGFLSTDELKRDALALKEAEAALAKAELAAEVYERFEFAKDMKTKESELTEAREEIKRIEAKNASQLAQKEADLDNKRDQLAARVRKRDKLKAQVDAATVTAPSDGLVVYSTSMERSRWGFGGEGPLQIGRQVHPNELLIVLPDTNEMVASVRVHESIAGRLRPGQAAVVKVDALGGKTISGEVASIGILAESGGWRDPNLREYTVKITLHPPEGVSLKPSMRCEAEVTLDRVDETLAVPIQAIFSEGPVRFVYLAEGARFVRRPVKIGRRSDRYAEIAAGISEGERVLLREPSAGEVLDRPWQPDQLAAAGLELNGEGQIVAMGGADGGAAPGGRRPRGPRPGAPKDAGTGEASATGAPVVVTQPAPGSEATTTTTTGSSTEAPSGSSSGSGGASAAPGSKG